MIILPVYQQQSADFQYQIELENQIVTIRITWNSRIEMFFLSITDKNANLISGIRLVPNWPLLQHRKGFIDDFNGDLMMVRSDDRAGDLITFDNLGNGWDLTYLTADEISTWRAENGLA